MATHERQATWKSVFTKAYQTFPAFNPPTKHSITFQRWFSIAKYGVQGVLIKGRGPAGLGKG